MIKALELFSGIGAFAEAAKKNNVNVIAAFDQDPRANETYALNHGLKPNSRNLDTITSKELPAADLWWMSPPCQPYSVRGNQKGLNDPRSRSFSNLMGILKDHRPRVFMLENVSGFLNSDGHQMAMKNLQGWAMKSMCLSTLRQISGCRCAAPEFTLLPLLMVSYSETTTTKKQ